MCALRRAQLAAGLQFFPGVLADGFQHHEARFAIRQRHLLQQTLVHHGRHAVQQVQPEIAFGVAYGFHTLQTAAPHEYGQPSKKRLLRGVQKLVAPINRAAQRLLALWQVPRAARQKLQPARQPREHGRRRKHFHTCRRELDRQRQAIQTRANLDHRGCILAVQFKIRFGGERALHKKRNRREL